MELRLNPKTDGLHEEFARAQPFPHLVIDNFLPEPFARELSDAFPDFSEKHALAEHGAVGGKAVREDVRSLGPSFSALDRYFSSPEFLGWMSRVTGIPDLLYDPEYLGGGTHENLPGQDLSVHVDFNFHPKNGWHRRLNALVYLNPRWEEDWGGELELWRDPWTKPSQNQIAKLAPIWNRLVVFPTTENSWHGFETVRAPRGFSRRSFALYLYTKERPAVETASMHSTIYFERPLPETIRPGKVLSREDFDELTRLTIRRDGLLQFLYRREKEFNDVIEAQRRQLRRFESQLGTGATAAGLASPAEEVETREYRINDAAGLGWHLTAVADVAASPSPGQWVVVESREGGGRALVFLHSRRRHLFLATRPASPRVALLHPSEILGLVVEVRKSHGAPIVLPKWVAAPLHGRLLVELFLGVHAAKNSVLGRVRSPLLWRLSQRYRRVLVRLGFQPPLLPP